MKHILTAASLALGACSATPEVRDPNAEEQIVIDEILARGAFEHAAVAEMVTRSDAAFFDEHGEATQSDYVVSRFAEMADMVVAYNREGKIKVFTPEEGADTASLEGLSHSTDTEEYIALNANEMSRWDFTTFMHEVGHQMDPEWQHSEEFTTLAEDPEGDGVTEAEIAEVAFRTHDFPYLASAEYTRIDDMLKDEAAWVSDVAQDTQALVESGELTPDAALAAYDERAIETIEEFATGNADTELSLFAEFYAVLGNTEDDLGTALRVENGPYAFVELQRAQYREGLEKWLTEREEGERRLRRESEESHRKRPR